MPAINYFKNSKPDGIQKKRGCYYIEDTKYPCIKKVVSRQGGYLVNIHLGKKKIWDDKNKCFKYKPNNTVKHVFTEKEALDLVREAQEYRKGEHIDNKFADKITVEQLINDYKNSPRFSSLTDTYKEHQENIINHILDYFPQYNDKYTCDLTTNDIEMYFQFQLDNGDRSNKNRKGISPNTVSKHKSVLKAIFNYAISCGDKYGISINIAEYAVIPKIKVEGYAKPTNHIEYHAKTLTLDELNTTLQDAIENEIDHSIVFFIALGALGGLRVSEIAGLKVGHFYHDDRMAFNEDLMERFSYNVAYYKQHDELMFINEAIKTIYGKEVQELPKMGHPRITAIPNVLREAADYMIEQRIGIYKQAGKDTIESTERMYIPLVNIIKGNDIHVKKINKKWFNYQNRRNRRLKLQGKEPIKLIRIHELRHTHITLLEGAYPSSLNISWNVGHLIPIKNSTAKYAHEPEPNRADILEYFNNNIKVDWSKAYKDDMTFTFNGSGHLRVKGDYEID